MMMKAPLFSLLLLLAPLVASADALVSVNAVNYPVWMERGKRVIPLLPGSSLNAGDLVRTGSLGRAWLSMADGSVVKLGESTEFRVTAAAYDRQQDRDVLQAAFDVIKGAFRFTTAFFKPRRKTPHQVNIKIGAITAGLRGTDIWGRANEEEDFVTLLEGDISVESDADTPRRLSQPLALYSKKRGQPADPPAMLEADLVPSLAQQTELSEQLGIATVGGQYELVLTSLQRSANTQRALTRFQNRGYAVQSMAVEKDGIQFIRLYIGGFRNIRAAQNLSARIMQEFDLQDTWINQRR